MVDMPVTTNAYRLSDDNYDPDDPENYMDVDDMLENVSSDKLKDDDEIEVVEEEVELE